MLCGFASENGAYAGLKKTAKIGAAEFVRDQNNGRSPGAGEDARGRFEIGFGEHNISRRGADSISARSIRSHELKP